MTAPINKRSVSMTTLPIKDYEGVSDIRLMQSIRHWKKCPCELCKKEANKIRQILDERHPNKQIMSHDHPNK